MNEVKYLTRGVKRRKVNGVNFPTRSKEKEKGGEGVIPFKLEKWKSDELGVKGRSIKW